MKDECYRDGYDLRKLYYEYNKIYAPDDMTRLRKGTFDISKFFKQFYINWNLCGPWRQIAFKKAENDPRFKDFVDEAKKNHRKYNELLDQLANSVCDDRPPELRGDKRYAVKLPETKTSDLEFICVVTDNVDFETLVEKCRKDWNNEHGYKSEVKSYEDAFKKALLILKPANGSRDPFEKRRVEVLYDAHEKIYLVSTTENTNPLLRPTHDGGFCDMLIYENGDVLAIGGAYAIV
jgi:hypothetical protein